MDLLLRRSDNALGPRILPSLVLSYPSSAQEFGQYDLHSESALGGDTPHSGCQSTCGQADSTKLTAPDRLDGRLGVNASSEDDALPSGSEIRSVRPLHECTGAKKCSGRTDSRRRGSCSCIGQLRENRRRWSISDCVGAALSSAATSSTTRGAKPGNRRVSCSSDLLNTCFKRRGSTKDLGSSRSSGGHTVSTEQCVAEELSPRGDMPSNLTSVLDDIRGQLVEGHSQASRCAIGECVAFGTLSCCTYGVCRYVRPHSLTPTSPVQNR